MKRTLGLLTAVLMLGAFGTAQAVTTSNLAPMKIVKATGVGISIKTENGAHTIEMLVPNAPAQKSGMISVGDELTAVKSTPTSEWVVVTGKTMEELSPLIRGEAGTQVSLRMKRAGNSFDVTLTRAEFEFDDESP